MTETPNDGATGDQTRRATLRRFGATAVGASVVGSASVRTAAVASAGSGTTMDKGTRYTIKEQDSFEGAAYTTRLDNNWMLSFVAQDQDAYTFAVGGLFDVYYDDGSVARAADLQEEVRMDVALSNVDDTNATLVNEETDPEDGERYSTVKGLSGTNWTDWKQTYEGQKASQDELEQELDARDYDDPETPLWLSTITFVGGVAASTVLSGGLAVIVGGVTTAVSGISLAEDIGDKIGDDCSVDRQERDLSYYNWWDYGCDPMTLTVHSSQFTVNVGDESGPVTLDVKQSYVPTTDYSSVEAVPNVGSWTVEVPNDGSDPVICDRSKYYDADGHSHL